MAIAKRPLGVWVSLALLILVGSACIGYFAGYGIARAHEYAELRRRALQAEPKQAHLEAVTAALYRIQVRRLLTANHGKEEEMLQLEVGELRRLQSRADLQDIRPVAEVELAITYCVLSLRADDVGNVTESARYMKLAQDLLRGVGRRDYSEETVRLFGKREMDRWSAGAKPGKGANK